MVSFFSSTANRVYYQILSLALYTMHIYSMVFSASYAMFNIEKLCIKKLRAFPNLVEESKLIMTRLVHGRLNPSVVYMVSALP
jgi:hypothetical protein